MQMTFTLNSIDNIAQKLWNEFQDKKVWALHAPMGAGKTTLVHALCNVLGVRDAVSSPTFALINEYESAEAGSIYHLDLYRIKNEEEAIHAGIEDTLHSGNFCFVEWPEKVPAIIPPGALHLTIKIIDEETRLVFKL